MEVKNMTALDYCEFVTDGTHDSPKPKENGFKLITSKHLNRYGIDFTSANFISEEDYKKIINRSYVEQWDILFSMIGTIGNLYIETNSTTNYACKNVGIFKLGGDEMKSKWLYYYLQSPKALEYVKAVSRGTTQSYVPLGALRKMPVDFFNDTIRDKIVTILWNLDEKIKLNLEINNNLEQQVTTAFYNMFGKYEQNSNTHKPLSTIAKFKYGTMPKKDKLGTGHYHAFSGYQIVGTYPEVMFDNPQLIIVARGVGGCGDVKYTPANCYLTNLSIAIITEKTMHDDYLYHYLRLHDTKIMNTGSAQPQITVATLKKFKIPIPPEEEMLRFSDFVQPFKQQYRNNQDENKLLSKLRDALLPKLMSGELDVSDIDL